MEELSPEEAFDAMRMEALKSYANLEWALATLLHNLLGIKMEKAALIFYRIVNTRARYGIIDDLMASEHAQYRKFWSRLETMLQACDTKRNHLAHWMSIYNADKEGFFLENPASMMRNLPNAARYGIEDLIAFSSECRVLGYVVDCLESTLSEDVIDPVPQPLLDIFRQPPENLRPAAFRQALFDATQLAPRNPWRV